ncbi:hypothetical protein KPH14_007464 [Odynerus spinipes]|uniref:Uncharacterized protein n=1 Tax=Odynerus spinipes TaxID=1348599 RepID=A0AAD9RAG1_9HYME|nr:hypothetical protein KPH14_007464 [Odynerus spinipes]
MEFRRDGSNDKQYPRHGPCPVSRAFAPLAYPWLRSRRGFGAKHQKYRVHDYAAYGGGPRSERKAATAILDGIDHFGDRHSPIDVIMPGRS